MHEAALNHGLWEGPSAEWGSLGSALGRRLGDVLVLTRLPAQLNDVQEALWEWLEVKCKGESPHCVGDALPSPSSSHLDYFQCGI